MVRHFFPITNVGDSSALLLTKDAMLRYTPGGNGTETSRHHLSSLGYYNRLERRTHEHIAAQFDRRRHGVQHRHGHRIAHGLASQRPAHGYVSVQLRSHRKPTAGTLIGKLITTDPNAGNTFTYSLVGGAGSADNASFAISGDAAPIRRDLRFRDQERLPNSGAARRTKADCRSKKPGRFG